MKKLFLFFILSLFLIQKASAQVPNCAGNDSNLAFIQGGNDIWAYNPFLPVSPTNPFVYLTNIGATEGLTISKNLNGGAQSPAFYAGNIGNYSYYDGISAWVPTGHNTGNGAAVNPGGGINQIINKVGGTGEMYKYDGAGNGTYLFSVPPNSGPYDVVTDSFDNIYHLKVDVSPGEIMVYNSAGVYQQSFVVNGNPIQTAGGGFCMVGCMVIASFNTTPNLYQGQLINGVVNLLPVGSTTVLITDMANCPFKLSNPPVGTPPTSIFNMSKDTICEGECITFTDLSIDTPTSWNWTFNGGTPPTSTNQNPGVVCFNTPGNHIISLTVTNLYGSNTSTKTIYVKPKPVAAIIGNNSICIGASTTLTAQPNGATYLWNNNSANQSITVSPIINTLYAVVVNLQGCLDSTTYNVTVNSLPTVIANALPSTAICIGDPITLSGSGANTYVWTAPVINNVPFIPIANSTYTVTGTDANGCTNTSSISITLNTLPVLSISVLPNDTICAGDQVTLTANGAANYSWSGGISNGVPFTPASTTIYTVTGTNGANCSATATQQITVLPNPIVNLGADKNLCIGDSLVLNAFANGATYLWNTFSSNSSITVKNSGLYWVQTNLGPCSNRDSINVIFNSLPFVELGNDTSLCEGQSLLLDATCAGCSYLWNDNSTNPTLNVNQQGNYSVIITQNNCKSSDNINISIVPLPIVDLGNDTLICPGDKIKLNASLLNASYLWNDGTKLSFITVDKAGTYWVQVTLGNCTSQDEKIIGEFPNCSCPIFIPNAFTPNNDGKNDFFSLVSKFPITLEYFKVYTRWGEEIFTTSNIEFGWEGNFNGKKCDVGTYFYIAKYKCNETGEDFLKKGDVSLIR